MVFRSLSYLLLAAFLLVPRLAIADPDPTGKAFLVKPLDQSPSITKRALIIGVQQYDPPVTRLNYTHNDAHAFADLLRARLKFPEDSIILMTDEPDTPELLKPTQRHIQKQIDSLVVSTHEDSEVVFFYSGHGTVIGDQDFLVPQDGDPHDPVRSCVSYTDFYNQLDTRRPRRALLVVDACRALSGKAGLGSGFALGSGNVGPEMAQLFSCERTEISQESDEYHQGVFTHFLLQGLQGDPDAGEGGVITFDTLKLYVRDTVSRYVAKTFPGATQNPAGSASFGSMVLAQIPPVPGTTGGGTGGATGGGTDGGAVTEGLTGGTVTGGLDSGLTGGGTGGTTSLIPNPPITRTNPKDGAVEIFIPAGEFKMGSNGSDTEASDDEKPQHRVNLDGYWIYQNVVTAAQYKQFCQATGHAMPDEPGWGWKDDHPVVNVTRDDAKAYCDWSGTRLPTAAEWEKAARGIDGRIYPWGNDFDTGRLWCDKAAGVGTAPAGSIPAGASPYGVLDMAGNVWQWCADYYSVGYYRSLSEGVHNPTGPATGDILVLRGGAWFARPVQCRSAFRMLHDSGEGLSGGGVGFRCAASR